ncbi:hydroxyisourate hydrolase [Ramlibacter rhizophilus]|uniref:Hydroxyisourate hydrolase n=1 Tax=Ramlibacter rhizophilus TaxID=1781167 RepID=A0A4Z0C2E7_9BURK|nr:hydroxyisourate hydrolase [Ramlibacter rhizophilus]TFZ05014.1 hydroxyisourate hydrolase [Ramlibacter rhizophilus]
MNAGLSVHCVDVAHGRVAEGLSVSLYRLGADGEPAGAPLASGRVGTSGAWTDPVLTGPQITAGGYEVRFDVGGFFRRLGVALPDPGFLEVVVYRFHVTDAAQHFHLPFKFTPWGFSLFRGGA